MPFLVESSDYNMCSNKKKTRRKRKNSPHGPNDVSCVVWAIIELPLVVPGLLVVVVVVVVLVVLFLLFFVVVVVEFVVVVVVGGGVLSMRWRSPAVTYV